jgi:S-adenosylmethionine/arginine decarboxylase-like enzyme
MKLAQHITIDLFGVKKRMGHIKSVMQALESQNKLVHMSLVSTPNCVIYLYKWGHIIIYSYPNQSMLSVDIFSSQCSLKTERLKRAMLEIFQPYKYETNEMTRLVGNV